MIVLTWVHLHPVAALVVLGIGLPLLCTYVFLNLGSGPTPSTSGTPRMLPSLALAAALGLVGTISLSEKVCTDSDPDCQNFYFAIWVPMELVGQILSIAMYAAWRAARPRIDSMD